MTHPTKINPHWIGNAISPNKSDSNIAEKWMSPKTGGQTKVEITDATQRPPETRCNARSL